ncbi:hypothetical protein ACO22_02619 [Paracoccidioides brasiliensis]|uniref:Uncharacterized protein n=1 Tax=Paracoccidioides brasiliensis TaxID=121759 RepID=A0A1D2JI62_PARBR|nr:hypothetical protein ACO22_02619 [Paracoccidioides brasiliensis]
MSKIPKAGIMGGYTNDTEDFILNEATHTPQGKEDKTPRGGRGSGKVLWPAEEDLLRRIYEYVDSPVGYSHIPQKLRAGKDARSIGGRLIHTFHFGTNLGTGCLDIPFCLHLRRKASLCKAAEEHRTSSPGKHGQLSSGSGE